MYLAFDTEVIFEFVQDEECLEQEKSCQSPIQSYALRLLEYNINASECLPLAEAPPTPDRLNDFGILKVPDQLSEVIYLNTLVLITCLFVYTVLLIFSLRQSASKPDATTEPVGDVDYISQICVLFGSNLGAYSLCTMPSSSS